MDNRGQPSLPWHALGAPWNTRHLLSHRFSGLRSANQIPAQDIQRKFCGTLQNPELHTSLHSHSSRGLPGVWTGRSWRENTCQVGIFPSNAHILQLGKRRPRRPSPQLVHPCVQGGCGLWVELQGFLLLRQMTCLQEGFILIGNISGAAQPSCLAE